MSRASYRIYPSAMDKFQKFLESEIDAEGFMNIDRATGEQKLTADEIAEQREQELIDSINRVPHGPIEAADKGTCFNEIVDCLLEHRNSSREDVVIRSEDNVIIANLNGFEFPFDKEMCKETAKYFSGSIPQFYCSGTIETRYGLVELYGYVDEIIRDKVYDIKTTSSYSFGKFENCWQKEVYPYCLMKSGYIDRVSEFEYTVFQLTKPSQKTPIIKGTMYKEVYTYDYEASTKRLKAFLERFIEWLEAHRDKITDKKIFNEYVSD